MPRGVKTHDLVACQGVGLGLRLAVGRLEGEFLVSQQDEEDERCHWADFDNGGRIVVTRGAQLSFYASAVDLIAQTPLKSYDLEQILILLT